MYRILLIDDDPIIKSLLTALLPEGTDILSALDGLRGLDILREYKANRERLDLVILDVNMPEFDGYETSVQIRYIWPAMPILPLTVEGENAHLDRYMLELQCAPPQRKGVHPNILLRGIQAALHMKPHVPETAAFVELQKNIAEKERRLRRQQSQVRVAMFASSILDRFGMKQLFEHQDVQIIALHSSPPELRRDLSGTLINLLIAPERDSQIILPLAHTFRVPALLLAESLAEGSLLAGMLSSISTPGSAPIGIVIANDKIITTLRNALPALLQGIAYRDPLLESNKTDQYALALDFLRAEIHSPSLSLSQDEIQFLLLEARDLDVDQIAHQLDKKVDAVYKVRSRLRQKLQRSSAELRQVARMLMYRLQAE